MKRLHPVSIVMGVATFLAAVAALSLDKSLPYRIGIADYGRYTWVGRLVGISVGLAVLTLLSGLVARKGWLSVGLAVFGLTPLLLIGAVHSGPNPEFWCVNNLRQVEGAKRELAREHGLTNGSPVTMADICRFLPEGRELRCAEHGTYIVNSIGRDARCTVHGTIPEMVANWQKATQRAGAASPNQPVQTESNQASAPPGTGH